MEKTYFAKQGMLSNLCALHAVNNLMGAEFFSYQTFNYICDILERYTRSIGLNMKNRHILGGDFDANVILKAVYNCGLNAKWVDSRKIYHYEYEEGTTPKGYIINIKQKYNALKKMLKLSDRHWICLKLYNLEWYILDSKKYKPELIKDIDLYLNTLLKDGSYIIEIRTNVNMKHYEEFYECVDNEYYISKNPKTEYSEYNKLQVKLIKEVENGQPDAKSQYDVDEKFYSTEIKYQIPIDKKQIYSSEDNKYSLSYVSEYIRYIKLEPNIDYQTEDTSNSTNQKYYNTQNN